MLKTDRFIKIGFAVLVLGHLVAAWFSFGYHHPDEHFQILEWANYFIGLTPDPSHLPWEFASQIRPWFQPLIHAGFMKLMIATGIYNPFHAAFFFRLLYAGLNIWAMCALWNHFQKKYNLSTKWFLLISLIWFLPYIHVRTSSENLAGIFLTFGLLTYLKDSDCRCSYFDAGILFGFAFLARYQIALGLVGLGLTLLYTDRKIGKKHLYLILGFSIPLAVGVLLDRWAYGNWVFTPYRYFKVNLLDHVAERYNPYPWYQYLLWIVQLNPFVSLPLFYGVIRYWFKNRLDPITTFTFSFFLLHCFITNKEYRFLFPILNFTPFMAAAYFQNAGLNQKPEVWFRKLWAPAFFTFFIALNLASFAVSSLHGASTQTHWVLYAVHGEFKDHPNAVWLTNRDYLTPVKQTYYDLNAVPGFMPHEMHVYHDENELKQWIGQSPESMVIIDGNLRDAATIVYANLMKESGCELITSAFPKFLSEKIKIPYQVIYTCKTPRK